MGFYGAYHYSGLVRQVSRFVNVVSGLLDLRAEENRVLRHVKPSRCGEPCGEPRALGRVRTQAIGALAYGFHLLS